MSNGPGWFASLGLLLLRAGFGGLMAYGHGWPKYQSLDKIKEMPDPMHLLATPYAGYALIGAELVCAALVAVGLLTRLVSLPVAYAMGVAAFVFHKEHPLFAGQNPGPSQEMAVVYMIAFAAIFFTGPGKFSLDHFLFGKSQPRDLQA